MIVPRVVIAPARDRERETDRQRDRKTDRHTDRQRQRKSFEFDDRLYSAILRSLEQTHCARMWFYMSD